MPIEDKTVSHYLKIIDDVVANVKAEFVHEGVDETVLDELRSLWEAKLTQTGAFGEPNADTEKVIEAAAQQPTTDNTNGATAQQQQQQEHQTKEQQEEESKKRKAEGDPEEDAAHPSTKLPITTTTTKDAPLATAGDQGGAGPSATAAPTEPPPKIVAVKNNNNNGGGGDNGEEEDDDGILSDLDSIDGADDDAFDEAAVSNVVIGQFDKVHRSKNKWKVNMKDCIMTINGRDFLVRKAGGEMTF